MSARGLRKCAHCKRKMKPRQVYRALIGDRWWCLGVNACVEAAKKARP